MESETRKLSHAVEKKGYSSGDTPASDIVIPQDAHGPGAGAQVPDAPSDAGNAGSNGNGTAR